MIHDDRIGSRSMKERAQVKRHWLKTSALTAVTVLAILGGALTGCGGSNSASSPEAKSGAQPSTPGQLDAGQQKALQMEQQGGGQPAATGGAPSSTGGQ